VSNGYISGGSSDAYVYAESSGKEAQDLDGVEGGVMEARNDDEFRHDALICIKNERKSTAGYLYSNAADFEKVKEQKECVWYYRTTQSIIPLVPANYHNLPTNYP